MSDASGNVRCDGCGLVNWASAEVCKRCGAALGARGQWASGDSWQPPSYGSHSARPVGGKSSGSFGKLIVGVIVLMALAGTFYGGLPEYLRGGPKWRDFTMATGNFSARMPADPDVNTQQFAPAGTLPWMGATARMRGNEECAVMFVDVPLLQMVGEDQLEAAVQRMAKSTESTILSKRPASFDGSRGIEVEMKPPAKLITNGHAYCRIYWIGTRMYMLMLVGREDGQLVRERNQFFDSFKLLRKDFMQPHSY